MTIAELIQKLSEYPPDADVKAVWDDCEWDIGPMAMHGRTLLIDVSDGHDALEYLLQLHNQNRD